MHPGWGFEDDLNPFGSGTGGSLIGPGHPGFGDAGRMGRHPGANYPGVPAGARFDPFGPPAGPSRAGSRGRGAGRGIGFGGPNPDHLAPPGMPNEFDFMYQ